MSLRSRHWFGFLVTVAIYFSGRILVGVFEFSQTWTFFAGALAGVISVYVRQEIDP